jgi:hypothetical protein
VHTYDLDPAKVAEAVQARAVARHLDLASTWCDAGRPPRSRHPALVLGVLMSRFAATHGRAYEGRESVGMDRHRIQLPKSTDLSVHMPDDLHEVAAELNTRTRQVLQWARPHATFSTLRDVPLLRP